jgi:hypothetical protein
MLTNFVGTKYRLANNWFDNIDLNKYKNTQINYLEIGAFYGANILSVAKTYGLHEDSKLYCIDPWEDYDEYSEYKTDHYVAKESKVLNQDKIIDKLKFHIPMLQIQRKATELAKLFNNLLKNSSIAHLYPSISFISSTVLRIKDDSFHPNQNNYRYFSVERFLDGIFKKYNSNNGYLLKTSNNDNCNSVAQAFSHWTYQYTNTINDNSPTSSHIKTENSFLQNIYNNNTGNTKLKTENDGSINISSQGCLVCDIQGVEGYICRFTDPSICSTVGKVYGETDLGLKGIKAFFNSHNCNEICKVLKLNSPKF